jgi:hypothetical protein
VETYEVNVDTRGGGSGVHNLLLSALVDANIGLDVLVLLSNKRRNVGLEATGSNSHNNKTEGEDSESGVRLDNDLGNGREDEDDVADNGEDVRILDGEVTSPVLIGEVGTKERGEVRPELVDCGAVRTKATATNWRQTYKSSYPSTLADPCLGHRILAS